MFILACLSKRCNLACSGCSATHTGEILTEENLQQIIATISKLADDAKITDIVLHGCETMMLEPEPLDKFLHWLRTTLPKVHIACQTNATLIRKNKEVFNVLTHHNVAISTSYRGTRDLFDAVTKVPGSYDDFVEGLDDIKAYMNGKVSAILYYPTELETEFNDQYKTIIDDVVRLGIKKLKVNEYESANPNKRYTEFVINCIEYIIEKQYDLELDPIVMLVKTLHGSGQLECAWRHNCKNFVAVNLDGTTGNCNRGYKSYKPVHPECLNCEIFGWCLGGCEAARESTDGTFPYCEQRRELMSWILKNRVRLFLYMKLFKKML